MKNLKTFVAIIGVLIAANLFAQKETSVQLKQAREHVYKWVDQYLEFSYLSSSYDVEYYEKLFKDQNVSVVNDYLPITEDKSIVVGEYCKLFLEDHYYKTYISTNEPSISIQEEHISDKIYACTISMQKQIMCEDSTGHYIYPKKDYRIFLELEYDLETSKIVCTHIYTSDYLQVEGILHQEEDSITNEYINWEDTIELLKNIEQYPVIISKHVHHMPFDHKMIEIRKDTLLHSFKFGGAVGASFYTSSLINNDFQLQSQPSQLFWSVNAGFYHQFVIKGNKRLGIEYGLSFAKNAYSLLGSYHTTYSAVDADGGAYSRIIDVENFAEKIQLYSIHLPVSLRYDHFITPNWSIFGSIGAFVSYDIQQQSKVMAQAKYAGYYDWLFGVTIDQNGIYDFGQYELKKDVDKVALSRWNIGAIASIGCQYFIPQSHWSIEPSIRYQASLFNPITHQTNFHLTEKYDDIHSASYLLKETYKHHLSIQLNINYHF